MTEVREPPSHTARSDDEIRATIHYPQCGYDLRGHEINGTPGA